MAFRFSAASAPPYAGQYAGQYAAETLIAREMEVTTARMVDDILSSSPTHDQPPQQHDQQFQMYQQYKQQYADSMDVSNPPPHQWGPLPPPHIPPPQIPPPADDYSFLGMLFKGQG